MKKPERKCQMTMGEYGNYYACGKPAKFVVINDPLRGRMHVCGVHARSIKTTNKQGRVNLRPLRA